MAEKRHGRGRPAVIVPLLAAMVFTAALVPASVRADGRNSALQPPPLDGVAPLMLATDAELERQLLEKYKPVMYLRLQDRECDRRGEAYDPTTVDVMAGVVYALVAWWILQRLIALGHARLERRRQAA